MNKKVLEMISFEIVSDVSEKDWLQGVQDLDDFYKGHEGYVDMQMVKEENRWMLVLNWLSEDAYKNASQKMMASEKTKNFLSYVVPQTVDKRILPIHQYR